MPNRDGTGPMGQGSLTGRGLGACSGSFAGQRLGRGFGRGFGFRRFQPNVELTFEQEKKILEAELAEVEAEKTELQKKLKELK